MPPVANDLVTARIVARFDGEPVINDLSFQLTDGFMAFRVLGDELVNELEAAIGIQSGVGPWCEGLSNQYAIQSIEVADVYPAVAGSYAEPSAAVGSVTTEDAMPPNDAMCVTLRTDYRGPGGRGRVYLTGFAEGSANGGYWEGGAQEHADAVMTSLITAFGELGTSAYFRWTIIHKYSNGGVRHAPVVKLAVPESKPVQSYTVHNEVRSLGRRAVGRRIHRSRPA